jgi:hypothetical protein
MFSKRSWSLTSYLGWKLFKKKLRKEKNPFFSDLIGPILVPPKKKKHFQKNQKQPKKKDRNRLLAATAKSGNKSSNDFL